MKFRFSIAVLLTISAMVAGYIAGSERTFVPVYPAHVPVEMEGIWRIKSMFKNGVDYNRVFKGPGRAFLDDCKFVEFVFVDDRLFVSSCDGASNIFHLVKLYPDSNSKTMIKCQLSSIHESFGGHRHAIVKRTGDNLSVALVDSSATEIDTSPSSNQIIFYASRH